jgi:hypothetical protein
MRPPKKEIRRAIKKFCLECTGSRDLAAMCGCDTCNLYPYRPGSQMPVRDENGNLSLELHKASILRAIRSECIDCLGSRGDICTSPRCELYPYRLGPFAKPKASAASVLTITGPIYVQPPRQSPTDMDLHAQTFTCGKGISGLSERPGLSSGGE